MENFDDYFDTKNEYYFSGHKMEDDTVIDALMEQMERLAVTWQAESLDLEFYEIADEVDRHVEADERDCEEDEDAASGDDDREEGPTQPIDAPSPGEKVGDKRRSATQP